MSWVWAGVTLDPGDSPKVEGTDYPERQQRTVIKHHPIGLATANSTIITDVGAPSLEPTFRFVCSETMRDLLISLEQTVFTVVDRWGVSRDWYLERLEIRHPPWSGTTTPRYQCVAYMVGR